MVRSFVSFGAPRTDDGRGIKDGVGPNMADWTFFDTIAHQSSVYRWQYYEIAERLNKYRRTQLPAIAHRAGYPSDTDWHTALEALKQAGLKAKVYEEKKDEILSTITMYNFGDSSMKDTWVTQLLACQIDEAAVEEILSNHFAFLSKEQGSKTVAATEFEETWYSKSDYNMRWPKKTKRLALVWQGRDKNLYKSLKNEIPFPSFKWDGTRMSVKLDKSVITQAITILKDHGYYTREVENYLNDMSDTLISTGWDYSAKVSGDGIYMHIPYNDTAARTIVKDISGRKWIQKDKKWRVPLSESNILIKKLGDEHKITVLLKAIPEVANFLQSKAERIAISSAAILSDGEVAKEMEEKLTKVFPENKALYPFQYAGVRFAELAGGRCLIGDDMGVGKTIQAIAYAALHEEYWPVLVVSPANVKYNWVNELKAWMPQALTKVIANGKAEIEDADVTVINYDLVNKKKDDLLNFGYNLIIFDESHYLKNNKTLRTKACVEIAESADSVLCLSGTAMTNRPEELFTTLNLIRPAEYSSFMTYAKRYCGAFHNGWGWDTKGATNVEELHERLRDVMIRRLKKEVLEELPDKIRQFFPVIPTDVEMQEYKNTHRAWLREYEMHKAANTLPAGFVLNMLTDLRHQCGRLKVGATIDWIRDYMQQNDKPLIVYAHHKDVAAALREGLNEESLGKWGEIHGGVPAQARTEIVEQFQRGEMDGLICSTIAAKEGLTLTAADTVVFIEREWVPGWEEQAEDRVNRIGQDSDTVWATYLSVAGTIDERFDRIVEEKRKIVGAVLDGGEVGERMGIAMALLESMVEAGEIPASMLKDMGGTKDE